MLVPNGRSRASLVVRLKGGDPYVFGRGDEEASALAEAGVPFEVVPGVTSALAALSYAGVPATGRRYTASFHVLTGHRKANGELDIDFDALVRTGGTDVFLMAVATLGEVSRGFSTRVPSPTPRPAWSSAVPFPSSGALTPRWSRRRGPPARRPTLPDPRGVTRPLGDPGRLAGGLRRRGRLRDASGRAYAFFADDAPTGP